MVKYVLLSDTTLTHEYRGFPLLQFLPCAPVSLVPRPVYSYLKGPPPRHENGRASVAPYAVRKIEAALLKEHKPEDVVVPHESFLENFIREDTEIIGVNTMDPLGLGPLTMSYQVFFGNGGDVNAYVKDEFLALIDRLNKARKGMRAKLVVGGPGVWEFTLFPEELEKLGIDYAFQGEADDIINELFQDLATGSVDHTRFWEGFQSFDEKFHKAWNPYQRFLTRRVGSRQFTNLEDIPEIVNPSTHSMVEAMRGCGIGCDFCEVTLRPLRYYPPEKVKRELAVNVNAGYANAWLHSDEIFAYHHGPHYVPNAEALIALFSAVISLVPKTNPTHGRISTISSSRDRRARTRSPASR